MIEFHQIYHQDFFMSYMRKKSPLPNLPMSASNFFCTYFGNDM
ncbi:hypothetical protein HMPREF1508_1870 [Shuttleworthella sp. MSX8B]|nr:hypothetical protein HMPREF1508_1870 [Shuttleworthia sp. MSX8B]